MKSDMTREEKAKAYDEALKRAKEMYDAYRFSVDLSNFKPTDFEYIFPQLSETEDERTRNCIRCLTSLDQAQDVIADMGFTRQDIIAWLEKQKDASKAIEAVERIDKYIDEHLANAHDMKDSNPDKKYYRGWDDALGKMAGILQDVYSGEKQKEQKHYWKPTETDVALFNKAVTTNKTLTPTERARLDIIRSKFGYCRAVNCSGIEQKPADYTLQSSWATSNQQKTVEKPDLVAELKHHLATTPKEQLQKEWDDLKEWGEIGPTVEEFLYGKPAEWSDEDEKMLNRIINDYENGDKYWFKAQCSTPFRPKIDWLKSLRPSWKPSEEQMNFLLRLEGELRADNHPVAAKTLAEIYEQLKAL